MNFGYNLIRLMKILAEIETELNTKSPYYSHEKWANQKLRKCLGDNGLYYDVVFGVPFDKFLSSSVITYKVLISDLNL